MTTTVKVHEHILRTPKACYIDYLATVEAENLEAMKLYAPDDAKYMRPGSIVRVRHDHIRQQGGDYLLDLP